MTDLAARKQAILDKISEVTALGNKLLGVTLPKIDVRFDLSGRAAGMACRVRVPESGFQRVRQKLSASSYQQSGVDARQHCAARRAYY